MVFLGVVWLHKRELHHQIFHILKVDQEELEHNEPNIRAVFPFHSVDQLEKTLADVQGWTNLVRIHQKWIKTSSINHKTR